MRGIKSNGMLLCASNEAHSTVEPLTPPEGSKVGERVAYGDDETATQPEPETPNKVLQNQLSTFYHEEAWRCHLFAKNPGASRYSNQSSTVLLVACALSVNCKSKLKHLRRAGAKEEDLGVSSA